MQNGKTGLSRNVAPQVIVGNTKMTGMLGTKFCDLLRRPFLGDWGKNRNSNRFHKCRVSERESAVAPFLERLQEAQHFRGFQAPHRLGGTSSNVKQGIAVVEGKGPLNMTQIGSLSEKFFSVVLREGLLHRFGQVEKILHRGIGGMEKMRRGFEKSQRFNGVGNGGGGPCGKTE